jgi:hypothetical protein
VPADKREKSAPAIGNPDSKRYRLRRVRALRGEGFASSATSAFGRAVLRMISIALEI